MAETIREQIFQNIGQKLSTALVENGYNLNLGVDVLVGFLPPLDSSLLPAVGFHPTVEESFDMHGYHQKFNMQLLFQGIAEIGTLLADTVCEQIYADIVEAVLGNSWTLGFDSGGPYKPAVGMTVEGETGGATGYIAGVSVSSGAWADEDAAGTFTMRRVKGDFQNNEQLNIGSNDDVATADGVAVGQNAVLTTTGGLADSIKVLSAQPQYPNQNQLAAGFQVVFGIEYKRVTGNPYSQTN